MFHVKHFFPYITLFCMKNVFFIYNKKLCPEKFFQSDEFPIEVSTHIVYNHNKKEVSIHL